MFKLETAFYLGEESSKGYSGIVAEGNLYMAIETPEGVVSSTGREFLKEVKEKFSLMDVSSLSDVDDAVSNLIKEKNLPLHVSFSLGYIKDNLLYLKTAGGGKIMIKRGGKVAVLLSGDNSASGYAQVNDIFVFTTGKFLEIAGGDTEIEKIFDHKSPTTIVSDIAPILKEKDDSGAVAVFLQFSQESSEAADENHEETMITQNRQNIASALRQSLASYYLKFGRRKTMTFALVLIIFLIFVYSVVFGYQRRANAKATEKINQVKTSVSQILSQAQELAYLNESSAVQKIDEAKTQLANLKKNYPKRPEIAQIGKSISDAENKILKKEEASYSEFFDLGVDNAKATGSKVYLDGSLLSILDKDNGVLYNLDLKKKSLAKNQDSSLKKASLVSSYGNNQYYYLQNLGVYTFDSSGKPKKVIDNDKDWVSIVDMATFNGNIYLMDKGKDEVYKYLSTDNGFGTKNSYFEKGQSIDLSSMNSLAIDSSVYVGGGNNVVKFTAGAQDSFKMNLPNTNIYIYKVITSKELSKVYLWDKTNGVLYVVDKSGEFQKQIQSSIFSRAAEVTVYKDQIYVLVGGKIYKLD